MYHLVAKTKKERHLWVGELCKAVEKSSNAYQPSPYDVAQLEKDKDPQNIVAEMKDMEPVHFLPLQTSNQMLYSKKMVRGYVMKKVQNQNAGLLQIQFHKRKMILDFDIFPSLTIAIGENMQKKDINLEDI